MLVGRGQKRSRIMESLYDRANKVYREMYLQRAKLQGWTGWENAGLEEVSHLSIRDKELVAALVAIEQYVKEANNG